MSEQSVCTGNAGYIGRELVKAVEQKTNDRVSGLDRANTFDSQWYKEIDLSAVQPEKLSGALERASVIFHLAAARTDWGLDYSGYERDNVLATRNLIEAARIAGIRKWVYFSTVGVYGPSNNAIAEDAPFRPDTAYGRTKAQAEEELLDAAAKEGWSLRIIRPSAVFSEHQPSNTNLYRLIEAVRRRRFVMIGDGAEIKTTSYLHNVVDAALWLYDDLASGGIKIYNYVDEPRLTTREMVEIIRDELGRSGPLPRVPLGLIEPPARVFDWIGHRTGHDLPITAARIRKFCTATNFASSKIRRNGFVPRYSSEEAIRRTVRWHMDRV